jgi:predicted protein tyrosine phosphatase
MEAKDFISVMSRHSISHYIGDKKYILISFYASDTDPAYILPDNNRIDTLFIKCDDIANKMEHWKCFDEEQAEQILHFVFRNLSKVDRIICQCDAGISRSSGTAAILGKILFNDDKFIYQNSRYFPNGLIYKTILEMAINKGYFDLLKNLAKERGLI